ncbi:hypothetical protein CCMSSC00406_0010205 [Pleurotus cornucopiae]|uniref:Uncharacterized protein n=1 Tax=Pleurotus cornucopiae TaxID=5321 RepID=A0ACB7IT11_PLECO|nr:hypothetical protein CCMSSC00406_0010205 [Pleurotus cornucopiae]
MGLQDAHPVVTPLEPGVDLSIDAPGVSPKTLDQSGTSRYRQAIGLLMYLSLGTRPDITYTVSTLSRFLDAPHTTHMESVKCVFKYLKGSRDLRLYLRGDQPLGYSNADFASDQDRYSILGYAFFIGHGAISWSSKKQPLVTLSSCESEYVALTHASKELLWLRKLVEEIFAPLKSLTTLYCDDQGAIILSKDSTFHAHTKHIDTCFHFICQTVINNQVQLIYCPTNEMVADIFTKSLTHIRFEKFRSLLGLRYP